ncbi:hypothetical protein EJB05_36352, partial [Eragrostis curvula]
MSTEEMVDWSSLPADLVSRVSDCFLATNDLDYYMSFRAVCHPWRSATTDPKTSHERRFYPTQWIILDEFYQNGHGRLFLNARTGRFLRKAVPLRGYCWCYRSYTSNSYILLTTTTGGFLILVDYDTSPPCAVSILNPFTGYSIRFSAPLPVSHETEITAAVVGPLPTLVLASVDSDDVYWADPLSETFHVEKYGNSPASRLPMIGAKYAPDVRASAAASLPFSYANKLFEEEMRMGSRCFVVAWDDGEVLLVFKQAGKRVVAHRVDSAGHVVEKVKSIGSRALFLGTRCLVVDADRFPTIGPNKIYYLREENPVDEYGCVYDVEDDIYAYAIEGDTENVVSSSVCAFLHGRLTAIQLISNYAVDIDPLYARALLKHQGSVYFQIVAEDLTDGDNTQS